MSEHTAPPESASTLNDAFQLHLDAALAAVDYRDPAVLKAAAVEVSAAIDRASELITQKIAELGKMRFAVSQLVRIRDKLLQESDYLKSRADFDVNRQGQTKERRSPNPVVGS